MTRNEYIAAVQVVLKHDAMVKRVHDVNRDLAREVGDDFGGIALTPETGLRGAFIKLVEQSCGDDDGYTSYLIDECKHMKGGGSVTLEDGTEYPIKNVDDCWAVIQIIKGKATPRDKILEVITAAIIGCKYCSDSVAYEEMTMWASQYKVMEIELASAQESAERIFGDLNKNGLLALSSELPTETE